ncbi:MAG: anhydro-N-acetylmuramic acid kinase, partial [Candidatus Hydrogenedentes bacterium]|nr:anhydro-N-acetylmuramic acid kinase [Candidatus Hydrogenedentota bacterium]
GEGPAMIVRELHHVQKLYPEDVRRRILAYAGGHVAPPHSLAELDRDIAISAAKTGEILLEESGVKAKNVEAVGWSAASVALEPPGQSNELGASLELGSAAVVASRLNRPVVSDFASSDIAAGGLGGPVTAWCDWVLLGDERLSRVTVHLGGIATVTFIPADASAVDVVAFDVGPGTAVSDELVHKFHHRLYDTDGSLAAGGRVVPPLLNELLSNPYFQVPPPKRTVTAEWSQPYISQLLRMAKKHDSQTSDLITTITELTAQTVARAVAAFTERPHEVILTGGGTMNIHLAGRIRKLLSPSSTYTVEKYGFGIRAKQAVCHAILAAARIDAICAHCPRATGAKRTVVLGAVTLP